MPPDPERLTATLAALAGGAFWGLYHLATALLAGRPVAQRDILLAGLNVAVGMLGGAAAAYFLAPALATLIPLESLRDLHAVGFGIGAGAWETAPFVFRALHGWADRKSREAGR